MLDSWCECSEFKLEEKYRYIPETSRSLEEESVKNQNYRCLFGNEEDSM